MEPLKLDLAELVVQGEGGRKTMRQFACVFLIALGAAFLPLVAAAQLGVPEIPKATPHNNCYDRRGLIG